MVSPPKTVVSLVFVTASFGCGWGPLGTRDPVQRSNAASCTAYVADLNERLTACGLLYDPANLCSSANYPGVDMGPYYTCLRERTRCEGGQLVLDDVDGCAPPLWVDAEGPAPPLHVAEEAQLRAGEDGR